MIKSVYAYYFSFFLRKTLALNSIFVYMLYLPLSALPGKLEGSGMLVIVSEHQN